MRTGDTNRFSDAFRPDRRLNCLLPILLALASCDSEERVFKVWHHGSWDIPRLMTAVPDLDVAFNITGPTHVFVSGHVDVMHRGTEYGGTIQYPIGIGMRLGHVGTDGLLRWIQGSKWGPNIASRDHHYIDIPLDGYLCIAEPGTHHIAVWATAHSTVSNDDGLAEISPADNSDQPGGTSDPYNEMIVRLTPADSC